jgi:hypothetical protein
MWVGVEEDSHNNKKEQILKAFTLGVLHMGF